MTQDPEGAEQLLRTGAAAGEGDALVERARARLRRGDRRQAECLFREAANAGETDALIDLADLARRDGDHDGAEALMREAADARHPHALVDLALMRLHETDREGTEEILREAADRGDVLAPVMLAWILGETPSEDDMDRLFDRSRGIDPVRKLMWFLFEQGDHAAAKRLVGEAADAGITFGRVPGTDAPGVPPAGLEPDGTESMPW